MAKPGGSLFRRPAFLTIINRRMPLRAQGNVCANSEGGKNDQKNGSITSYRGPHADGGGNRPARCGCCGTGIGALELVLSSHFHRPVSRHIPLFLCKGEQPSGL